MYDSVIIRYGEIFLKSEFVRRKFEKALVGNLKFKLKQIRKKGTISWKRHRIYVNTGDAEDVANKLADVFGVVSASPAMEIRAALENICSSGLEFSKKIIKEGDTFAIRAERAGEHDFKSRDVEVALGDIIRNSLNAKVDLENPKKTIFVEIREERAFIFDMKIMGLGGLPYGTQGKVVALISDDINSGIAAWMMMRRGCEIIAVHEKDLGRGILEKLRYYSDDITGYTIDKTDNIYEILENIAEKEGAHGIVTGSGIEDLDKKSIRRTKIPIYWPLIGMGKKGIDGIGKRAGFL